MGYFTRIGKKYNLETGASSSAIVCEICKEGNVDAILRFKDKVKTKILPSGHIWEENFQNALHMCGKCMIKYKLDIRDFEKMKQGIALLKMRGII